MAPESFKVSVPGSLMLMGEHAVLQGKQAIVCAIDKRLQMELIPTASDTITITDSRLGTLTININDLEVQDPFKFVLQTILLFKDQLPSGFTLQISSEFSSVIGFGSSAAVTVATIAVLGQWLQLNLSHADIFNLSHSVILELQGFGSGADIAASIHGGTLAYHCAGRRVLSLPSIPALTAVYCGYKTPTTEVIKIVQVAQHNEPEKFAAIFDAMDDCAKRAISAIQSGDWPLLGKLFLEHHNHQRALGTSDDVLDALVASLTVEDHILGAKISGAGLGDCVIGLHSCESGFAGDAEGGASPFARSRCEELNYMENVTASTNGDTRSGRTRKTNDRTRKHLQSGRTRKTNDNTQSWNYTLNIAPKGLEISCA